MPEPPPAPSDRPTATQRLLYGIPLFLYCAMVALLPLVMRKFEDIFQVFGVPLPYATTLVLAYTHAIADFPYVLMPAMFAGAWFYLAWGCKTRQRMLWFSWTMLLLCVLLAAFVVVACYLPLSLIEPTIRKR